MRACFPSNLAWQCLILSDFLVCLPAVPRQQQSIIDIIVERNILKNTQVTWPYLLALISSSMHSLSPTRNSHLCHFVTIILTFPRTLEPDATSYMGPSVCEYRPVPPDTPLSFPTPMSISFRILYMRFRGNSEDAYIEICLDLPHLVSLP